MGRNLTNLNISSSFQHLLQISSSNTVNDGTGSLVTDLDISASYAVTASHALNANTGSLLVTSSATNDTITFTKGDGSTYTNVINNVSASLSAGEIFVRAKNVQGVTIPKGFAVHSAGVTGENINITTASYNDANLMPAIGITQEDINAGAVGEVIISGRLKNVNTSGLVAGRTVYVNGDGALTATRPTGSALIQNIGTCAKVNATEGEIIVVGAGRSNDLPNITTDYVWKGDSNGVPQAVAQSSLSVGTAATASYVNPLVQDVQVTGSIRMDGDIYMDKVDSDIRFLQNPEGGNPSNIKFYSGSTYGTNYFHIQSIPGEQNSLTIALQPNNLHFIDFQETGSGLTIPRTNIPTYLRVSGSKGGLNVLTEWPASFGVEKVWDFGTWTSPGGGTYSAETRLQNYGSLGAGLEGIIDVFSEEPNFGGTNYASLVRGPKFVGSELVPTGSAGFGAAYKGQITLQDIGSAQTRVNIDANDISIGTTAVNTGTFNIGKSGQAVNFLGDVNITGDLTGSNAYFQSASIGYLQTITGSAKIIGDEFIILNNDTPTSRYAGIKVIDSGSSAATASLLFDGQTNDWFYEYTSSGDALNHGVVLFGPEYGTIGSPTYNTANTIVKSDGGHHILDSNITDNGSSVGVNANFSVSGSSVLSGSFKNVHPLVGTNTQSDIWSYPTFTTTQGTTYNYNYGTIGNYPAFGQALEQYREWYIGNLAFTEYANLLVGPNKMMMQLAPSGTGATANIDIRRVNATTSRAVIYADDIQIGQLTGDVGIGNNSHTSSIAGGVINIGGASTSNAAFEGTTTQIGTVAATDVLISNNSATSSLFGDYINVGINGNTTNLSLTGTEIETHGRVTGDVNSLSIASTTASLDAQAGNYFDLTLVDGANTHVTVSNIVAGQTYILKTTNGASGTGTITFNSEFKFSGGAAPTATGAANAIDVYTFVSYDTSEVLSTQVTDLK